MSSSQLRNVGLGSGDGGTTIKSLSRVETFDTITTKSSRARATTTASTHQSDCSLIYPTTWYRWLILLVFSFVASGNGMAFMAVRISVYLNQALSLSLFLPWPLATISLPRDPPNRPRRPPPPAAHLPIRTHECPKTFHM